MSKEKEPPQFSLNSSESGFSERSKDIFGGLGNIEQKHFAKERAKEKFGRDSAGKYIKDDPIIETIGPRATSSTSERDFNTSSSSRDRWREDRIRDSHTREGQYSGDNRRPGRSEFKVPHHRAPRSRFLPDHKKNPQNYTFYNLDDVPPDQMSERTNSAAAFQFMQERRVKKENEMKKSSLGTDKDNEGATSMDKSGDSDCHKIMFKRPKHEELQSTEPEPELVGSKLCMPEYVVGVSSKRKKKKSSGKKAIAGGDKVGLEHLGEEGDSSDDPSDLSDLSDEDDKGKEEKRDKNIKLDPKPLHEEKEVPKSEEPVMFKSRKDGKKKRGLRRRHDEDDDDNDEIQ